MNDSVMLLIVCLHFECNIHTICKFLIVRLRGHEMSIFEEADVLEAQEIRAFQLLHIRRTCEQKRLCQW
jgi:hypothetical protein